MDTYYFEEWIRYVWASAFHLPKNARFVFVWIYIWRKKKKKTEKDSTPGAFCRESRHKQTDFTQPLIGAAAAINVRPLIVQSYKDKQRQRQLG